MKKLNMIFILTGLFLCASLISFGQGNQRPHSTGSSGTVIAPNRDGELDCPANSIFSQAPVNSSTSYFSDNENTYYNQKVFENFYGLTSNITGITFWGILWNGVDCYPGGPVNFAIEFYQDNSGSVGTLVQSFPLLSITPIATGSYNSGASLLRFDVILPSAVSLASGWFTIYRLNPGDPSCIFAWTNTTAGDNYLGFNAFNGQISYFDGTNESFCFTGGQQPPMETPVSNWALFIGIGLILIFAVIRFRRVL